MRLLRGSGRSGREGDVEARVLRDLAEVWDPSLPCGGETLEDVAWSVGASLRDEPAEARPDLRILAARALAALGNRGMGRRLLLEGTGVLRERTSSVAPEGRLLVLDLRRLRIGHGDGLDMTLVRAVLALLEATRESWRASGGRGALGLRGLRTAAADTLRTRRAAEVDRLVGEVMAFGEGKLRRMQEREGWPACPLLWDLDKE